MSSTKGQKSRSVLEDENRRLSDELAALQQKQKVELTEGVVIHEATVPLDAPREAFGKRNVSFDEITNFNWLVRPRVIVERKKGLVEGSNGKTVSYDEKRTPCTMITVVLKRAERGGDGVIASRERGGVFPLPFRTWDNSLTAEGVSVRDVALTLWQQREIWGKSYEIELQDETQVNTYWTDRMSDEQAKAREAMADPSYMAGLAGRNDDLINQGILPPVAV
jgi:hypothetical protein